MRPLMSLPSGMVRRDWRFVELLGLQDLAQADDLALGVGDFDAHGGLAGDALDEDGLGLKAQAEVLVERGDAAVLDAGLGLELEGGDHRAGIDLHHRAKHVELLELGLDAGGDVLEFQLVVGGASGGFVEQVGTGEVVALLGVRASGHQPGARGLQAGRGNHFPQRRHGLGLGGQIVQGANWDFLDQRRRGLDSLDQIGLRNALGRRLGHGFRRLSPARPRFLKLLLAAALPPRPPAARNRTRPPARPGSGARGVRQRKTGRQVERQEQARGGHDDGAGEVEGAGHVVGHDCADYAPGRDRAAEQRPRRAQRQDRRAAHHQKQRAQYSGQRRFQRLRAHPLPGQQNDEDREHKGHQPEALQAEIGDVGARRPDQVARVPRTGGGVPGRVFGMVGNQAQPD